jgi:protein-S-isoprenylcysteine O-methyltransferase Ste14
VNKEWWKSKTLWVNIIALVVALATWLGSGEIEVQPWVVAVAGAVITIANMVLRIWFTDTKLTK